MNEPAVYAFHGAAVRIHTDGDTVEYCARDIAGALGYANPNDAIRRHCKGIVKRYPLETAGGTQEMAFIGEGDVYRLIVSSQLPAAVEFEHWLFDEVVPAIRRTGGYIPVKADDDEKSILARAVLIAQSALADKDRIIASQRTRIARTEPLALTAQALCDTQGSMSITDAARHFMQLDRTMCRNRVIRLLRAAGEDVVSIDLTGIVETIGNLLQEVLNARMTDLKKSYDYRHHVGIYADDTEA